MANSSTADDWQQGKTAKECHEHMLEKQLACDVIFKLRSPEKKVIGKMGAHKFILISRSPVFFAMFEGSMKETSDEVVITDIDGEPFRQFLRYLYLDEVHLSDATCVGILYAAKKYMVKSLQEKCKEHLRNHIRQETVWSVLEHAVQMDEEDLVETALEFIDESTEECLLSPLLKQISHGTLCKLLARDTLEAEEVCVFRACLEWAGARCLDEGVPVSVEKIRKDLGKALYLIRFPVMDISDFSNRVVTEGLLSDKEIISVFLALTREKPPPELQFPSTERQGKLADISRAFVTGLTKTNVTGGPFNKCAGPCINPGKPVKLHCVFFANVNQEVMKKVKKIDVLSTETFVVSSSDEIRYASVAEVPNNGYYNAKAIFKDGVDMTAGHYTNVIFHFDPPITDAELIYFNGTPVMNGNDVPFTFEGGTFYAFIGVGFK